MSSIGSPIDTSLLQTAQAQQTAAKAKDKEKEASRRGRRLQDLVDLRVVETEGPEALRKLPRNDSEQADSEHEAQDHSPLKRKRDGDDQPHVDVRV